MNTSWRSAEHWLRAGADGWRLDVPEEIREPGFWQDVPPAGQGRQARMPTCSAEIWVPRPERLGGDEFDAVMDYPLAEALLGFCGGSHLDMGVVRSHNEYAAHVHPMDGAAFAAELERLLGLYDPAVTAVQFNLLGSHDTPRFVTVCGGDRDSLRLATLIQMTLPGAPSIYYGDEIGMEGGARSGEPRRLPAGPRRLGPGPARLHRRRHRPAPLECHPARPGRVPGGGGGRWLHGVRASRSRRRASCGSWP